MDRGPSRRIRSRAPTAAGVSLPELLVVISILALGVMISIPLIAARVHEVKVRAAADRYAMTLRAARMIAVAQQAAVTVTVLPAPDNRYEYPDSDGRRRSIQLPGGVSIEGPESTGSLTFQPDGSLSEVETTVFKAMLSAGVWDTWTIDVPLTGIPRVSHEVRHEGG